MAWFAAHGVSHTYEEYLDLPLGVFDDCRMLMRYETEAIAYARQHSGGSASTSGRPRRI